MNDSLIKLTLYGGPEDGRSTFETKSNDRYFPSPWPDLIHHYHRVGDTLVYQGVVDR